MFLNKMTIPGSVCCYLFFFPSKENKSKIKLCVLSGSAVSIVLSKTLSGSPFKPPFLGVVVDSSSLQNWMTGAGWNFFCTMIVNPNQSVPSSFPIISYRSLLFDNSKTIPFEQLNQFAEFQSVSPIISPVVAKKLNAKQDPPSITLWG